MSNKINFLNRKGYWNIGRMWRYPIFQHFNIPPSTRKNNCNGRKFLFFLLLFFYLNPSFSFSQQTTVVKDTLFFLTPSKEYNSKRFIAVTTTTATLYAGTMTGLYVLWYKDYPLTHFHFFNDNEEWQQMDKIGHVTTAYQAGKCGIDMLSWTGVERKKAIWYGGLVGTVYQTSVEVLDGFSPAWGFSFGDELANITGSALLITQALAWNEQRIQLKYSFHQTDYPSFRPNLLGGNLTEQWLKDYNGQTYWASVNINSFLKKTSRFPKWLNVAVGYGAEGMTGGSSNPTGINGTLLPYFDRYRKYYLSLDVDLEKLETRSLFLKTLFQVVGFIKFPAPALEYNEKGKFGFYWLYF